MLVTKEDFKSRTHYLNMQNCLKALLNNEVVPIINENDVVSITELMFTDNDELAGLVSAMMNADRLIILSNVDGVFDGPPENPAARLIDIFDGKIKLDTIKSSSKSGFGRGGILTKAATAEKISRMGIPVHICNGKHQDVISRIINGEKIGTLFPARKVTSNIKKYIAHAYEEPKGRLVVSDEAKNVLLSSHAISLLPIGIIQVTGEFKKGDIVRIMDQQGQEVGLGLSRIDDKRAREIKGRKNEKPVVHYDHLYLH